MSALKRLLSASHHKLQKHNSLPSNPDGRVDFLDLDSRINKHERSQSKPPTPISASTPTYQTDSPISSLPLTLSPSASSGSSSNSTARYGRSRSRARAKHERAKSLEVRVAQSRQASLDRAERRRNSYERVGLPLDADLCVFLSLSTFQDTLKDNYGELPMNMSQGGIG